MVRKIKNNSSKEDDALQNPKRSERKYKQALLKILKENGFSYEDFIKKPEYLKNDYIDEKTMLVVTFSNEIVHGVLHTFEKIIFSAFNNFLKEKGVEHKKLERKKIKIIDSFAVSDIVFFEVMINSPNVDLFFEKFKKIIVKNTNFIELLKEFVERFNVEELLEEFFLEENRNFLFKENNFFLSGKENLKKLSEKEFNEKYYSLTEGDYLFSSLEEDIHIRFEGFNENNNPLFSFTGEKEIEVRDKIGAVISQKGTWIEDNVVYIEKEKIKKALKELKKEIKIFGYIEYNQKKEELKIDKTEKTFSIQNEISSNLLDEIKKQNTLLPKIEKITFSDKEEKRNIPFVEFLPDEIEQKLDLSWFFLEENSIELTKADLERFNKENNLIENIIFLSQKKKL